MPHTSGIRTDEGMYLQEPLALWKPATYRIVVRGRLDQRWTVYFGRICMSKEQSYGRHVVTTFLVRMDDQAALLGALNFLYNMGLPLLLVECVSVD